jgi:hypothetical protein
LDRIPEAIGDDQFEHHGIRCQIVHRHRGAVLSRLANGNKLTIFALSPPQGARNDGEGIIG